MTGMRMLAPAVTAVLAVGGGAAALVITADSDPGMPHAEIGVAVVLAVYAGTGLLISWVSPRQPVGRLLLVGAAAWGVGEAALAVAVTGLASTPGATPGAAWLALLGPLVRGAGWLVLVLAVPLVFPDGRPPSPPWRWAVPVAVAAFVCFLAANLLAPTPLESRLDHVANPLRPPTGPAGLVDGLAFLSLGLAALALLGAVGALVTRWRTGSRLVRQQLLWFIAAAAVPVVLFPLIAADLAPPVLFGVAVLPLPVAIAVAVLQHRLYDMQFVASRTLGSVALSGTLAVVYVAVVGGVGALLEARGARWLPWLGTGVVALSFAPLRDALGRAANRVVYGRWAEPEAVLATVRRQVADAGDVQGLLTRLVREIGEGLGLARIVVLDAAGREIVSSGTGGEPGDGMPLTAFGRPVGTMRWTAPQRPLRASDRRLLEDIGAHLGALVHTSGLVAGLRSAQERLVLAREDERRRLRRDLHDGLGSALAGMTFTVEAARNLLETDADAADRVLRDLRSRIQETVVDVRRVVEGLRPPSLDELGLVGALRELCGRLGADLPEGIALQVSPDLPPLSAAAEVAAYRVAQEAVTNVVRHSGARRCRLSLCHDDGTLVLEVADDGSGGTTPRPGGAGLPGMAERAEELGGTLEIRCGAPGGTTVRLRLPVAGSKEEPCRSEEVATR